MYVVCHIIFLVFRIFHIQKGVQVIIVNIRKMSSVTMLQHLIFYKKGLVIIYKSCFKRLILSLPSSDKSHFFNLPSFITLSPSTKNRYIWDFNIQCRLLFIKISIFNVVFCLSRFQYLMSSSVHQEFNIQCRLLFNKNSRNAI